MVKKYLVTPLAERTKKRNPVKVVKRTKKKKKNRKSKQWVTVTASKQ